MSKRSESGAGRPPIPGWKRGLLVASLLVGLLGVGLTVFAESGAESPATGGGGTGSGPGSSLLPGSTPTYPDPDTDASADGSGGGLAEWGPPVARFGFSFFVGFAIAYALRAFFKLTLILLGGVFLLLFGLQYAGLIEIDWNVIGSHYDSVAEWVSHHAGSFKDFVTGHLPTAGSAVAGMVLGFRRR